MKAYSIVFLLAIVLLELRSVVAATPIQISGQFADASAQPLAYISIGVVNTPAGTVADAQDRWEKFWGMTTSVNLTFTRSSR